MAILPPNQDPYKPAPKAIPTIGLGQNAQYVPPAGGTGTPPAAPTIQPGQVQPIQAQQAPQPAQNQQVLAQAQNKALSGFKSPTLDLTSDVTRQFLANPQLSYNAQKGIQAGMDQFNLQSAQGMEKLRRETAPLAHSGDRMSVLQDLAFQQAQQGAFIKPQLEREAADYERNALIKALEQGRATSDVEQQRFVNDVNALVDVRGAAEGERAQTMDTMENAIDRGLTIALSNQNAELETALLGFKEAQQTGRLITQQDFQSTQAELDRALEDARMKGDWASAKEITELKGQIDAQAQASQQEFMAAQSALDREGQQELTKLKGDIDKGLLLTQQDFAATQASLDRALEEARMTGDWENAEKITKLKGQIDAQAQQAEREWKTSENLAQRSWATDERLSEEEFSKTQQFLEREHQLALQNNDIEAQKDIAKKQRELQLTMQTNGMTHDETMTRLNDELANATAENDVERQKSIIEYKALKELEMMREAQGFEETMATLNKEIQIELDNNNNDNATALMEAQQRFAREEAVKDRVLETIRLEMEREFATGKVTLEDGTVIDTIQAKQLNLQQNAMDMQKLEQQYNYIQNEIEAGRAHPDAAMDFVNNALKESGIQLDKADPNAIYKELERDYKIQKYQFAQANPEYAIYDKNHNFVELREEGEIAFNNFLQKTYYGPDGKIEVATGGEPTKVSNYTIDSITKTNHQELEKDFRNADVETNPNYEKYAKLLAEAPTLNVRITNKAKNELSDFNQNDVYNVGGRLMIISTERRQEGKGFGGGRKRDEIELMDLATGIRKTFSGKKKDNNNVNTIGSWAANLNN